MKLFARLLELAFDDHAGGYFAPLRVNETLTFDFHDDVDRFETHYYAFKVSNAELNAIFGRIQIDGIPYGSEPNMLGNMDINHRGSGRGVYCCDPNGHILELLTVGERCC